MSTAHLSSARTIVPSDVVRSGTRGRYHRLTYGPGEARVVRSELAGDTHPNGARRSLLRLTHFTDLHLADVNSPGRFEFVERFWEQAHWKVLLPAYRPQELLSVQVIAAAFAAANAVDVSPVTGAASQMVVLGGDLIDNAQANEMHRFLALLRPGTITLPPYEGVATWGDPAFWRPDDVPDEYKREWGFPAYPGLLREVAEPFSAEGIRVPWISCPGNHDGLIIGTAVHSEAYERLVTGGGKPSSLPEWFEFDPMIAERFLTEPEAFLSGITYPVTPDPQRRRLSREEFIRAQMDAPGLPLGHGYQAPDRGYSAHDIGEQVRLILLDTNNLAGHYEGSLDDVQYHWLEERLAEVHGRYLDEAGRTVQTGAADRLVVIVTHHELETLTNARVSEDAGQAPHTTDAVAALLHRFPNVVLWLNGHTHRNRVRARFAPGGEAAGFWEVTTSSLIDWPTQGRVVELVDNGDGTLSVLTDMLDHAGPAVPDEAEGFLRLAAIHRELAANDPHAGMASSNAGTPADRTTDLRLRRPF